jgi:hypothetical protein
MKWRTPTHTPLQRDPIIPSCSEKENFCQIFEIRLSFFRISYKGIYLYSTATAKGSQGVALQIVEPLLQWHALPQNTGHFYSVTVELYLLSLLGVHMGTLQI